MQNAIDSGAAVRVAEKMIAAQHGDARVASDPSRLALAPERFDVVAERAGFVVRADALAIGRAAVAMGAGRARAEDTVDPAVGISVLAKPGDRVERGQPLAALHVRKRDASVEERVRAAYAIGDEAPAPRPLFIARID